jgi:hypothetical protein
MRLEPLNRAAGVVLLSLVALLAAACGSDTLAPSTVSGTYVLLSINGNALPAAAGYQGPADGSVTVFADTLRLAADGSGSLVRVEQSFPDESPLERRESPLHFETTEDGLTITFDCPPNALMLCVGGPHIFARFAATGLTATRPLGSENSEELVYSRVERLD